MLKFNRQFTVLLFLLLLLFACDATKNLSNQALEQQALTAKENGEWFKAAQLFETLYQRKPTDEKANYEAGTNFLKANNAQKGLTILQKFDRTYENKSAKFNGRLARLAKAYYKTEQFMEVAKMIENYDYPLMYRGLAREHLKSLIQLQDEEALAKYFYHYQKSGIYDDKGKKTNAGFLYRAICNEYLLMDNPALLDFYARRYAAWAQPRSSKDQRNVAIATVYQKDYTTAIEKLSTAIATEDSPRHQLELIGLLGVCYAKLGQPEAAKQTLEKINAFPALPPRHDAFGAKFYHQARVEVALGNKETAIQSLKKALANKAEFWSNRFTEDGLLKGLFGEADFKDLVGGY